MGGIDLKVKVGINGFGRIGRNVLRIVEEMPRDSFEIVAINARASLLFIQSGAITGTEFWTSKSADKFGGWDSNWKPGLWECIALAEKFGKDKEVVTNEIYSTFLAKGIFDVAYQTYFKNYIKTIPVEKAKTLIKNELLAFASVMNPDNEVQAKWLTTLRLLNTTYSEL